MKMATAPSGPSRSRCAGVTHDRFSGTRMLLQLQEGCDGAEACCTWQAPRYDEGLGGSGSGRPEKRPRTAKKTYED